MFGLAFAYLRDRALTTWLNIVLLALAVATLVILLLVSTQLGERFERDARGVDLVVGAKGSPLQLILSSVYHVDMPTGNIPLDSVELLRRNRSVAEVIPLALGDSFRGYRIVGTEASYPALHDAKLAQGRMFAKAGEAVMGAAVARELGATIGQRFVGSHGLSDEEGSTGHDEHPFTMVGILAPTGTVLDRLILTSIESVWDVHGIGHEHEHEDQAPHEHDAHEHEAEEQTTTPRLEPEVTALLVRYRSALGAVQVPGFINRQTEMQAAVPAIETARLLSLFGAGVDGARLFAWLLAAIGGLSIFVALLNAARAREGDLALLRVMGARRGQVFGTVLLEGLLTAAAGVVIGIAAAHLLLVLAVRSFVSLEEIGFDPFRFHPGEAAIALAVLGIGIVAAAIPALGVFRTDPALTLARA
jgi:putative ABC transport system permease protein